MNIKTGSVQQTEWAKRLQREIERCRGQRQSEAGGETELQGPGVTTETQSARKAWAAPSPQTPKEETEPPL